jgi:hypothetical protein
MSITLADRTQYPKIFENTYWGCFSYEANSIDEPIFENRNRFVKKFDIQREFWPRGKGSAVMHSRFRSTRLTHFCDHIEGYVTRFSEFVVICSNYNSATPPPILGMQKYSDKLYSDSAETFIRVFQNYRVFKDFMWAVNVICYANSYEPFANWSNNL